jgi:hypothetical protein
MHQLTPHENGRKEQKPGAEQVVKNIRERRRNYILQSLECKYQ